MKPILICAIVWMCVGGARADDIMVRRTSGGWRSGPDRVAMKTTADILIQAGAEINATDQDGNTALHWAVARRCTELCAFLLSKGANPAIKNNKNETALDWATKASDGNRNRMIELLRRPPAPNR